ncbi:methyltransferase [Myriangium duriaei CBS 260.36]|uniref:Methyltransferase n=1 Tax=Myriangium duriaei CBS 260.36 TaxID=1168546 RepID=A0A9P4JEE5_9PEZI|nr:methyltransferase [Myriangium duriaei CBS 260.36]
MTSKPDHWSSAAYSSSASFVPQLTTKVTKLFAPRPGENIIDLGCGDGVLTAQLSPGLGQVLGLDASPAMIRAAQDAEHSKNLTYAVHDCAALRGQEGVESRWGKWDGVFSNAALHWVLRSEEARRGLFEDCFGALKQGGRLVFEMGGKGNVAEVHAAIVAGLVARGGVDVEKARESIPWFFPSEVWMKERLEKAGFKVEVCEMEYRPTKLNPENKEGSGGLEGWVRLMAAPCLAVVEEGKKDDVVRMVCDVLRGVITREEDGSQWIGYVRLRAVAVKP